jgi:hypothetical protein
MKLGSSTTSTTMEAKSEKATSKSLKVSYQSFRVFALDCSAVSHKDASDLNGTFLGKGSFSGLL